MLNSKKKHSGLRLLRVTASLTKPASLVWTDVDRYTKKSLWIGTTKLKRNQPTVAYVENEEQAQKWLIEYYHRHITILTCEIDCNVMQLVGLNALLSGVWSEFDLGNRPIDNMKFKFEPSTSGVVS